MKGEIRWPGGRHHRIIVHCEDDDEDAVIASPGSKGVGVIVDLKGDVTVYLSPKQARLLAVDLANAAEQYEIREEGK